MHWGLDASRSSEAFGDRHVRVHDRMGYELHGGVKISRPRNYDRLKLYLPSITLPAKSALRCPDWYMYLSLAAELKSWSWHVSVTGPTSTTLGPRASNRDFVSWPIGRMLDLSIATDAQHPPSERPPLSLSRM